MFNGVNSELPRVYPASEAPAQTLVRDVLVKWIGKELSFLDFYALSKVCMAWQAMIQPNIEDKLLEEASFGVDKWLRIPGVFSVSEVIPLTQAQKIAMIAKLKSVCKIFNEKDLIQPHRFQNDKIKRMWQTHKLIFYPEKINGEPRTINSQNRLFHFIKQDEDGTAFEFIVGKEVDAFRKQLAPKSCWGLAMLDLAPGSRNTSHATKEDLLKRKGYRVLTPNDAATTNLIVNLGPLKEKKGYFFGREGKFWTYTATTELYNHTPWRLVVGAAAPLGPKVHYRHFDDDLLVGVAGVAEVP